MSNSKKPYWILDGTCGSISKQAEGYFNTIVKDNQTHKNGAWAHRQLNKQNRTEQIKVIKVKTTYPK